MVTKRVVIRILGPLQVELPDGRRWSPRGKRAGIVALLAAACPQMVGRESLYEALWPNHEVRQSIVHSHMSKLRSVTGLGESELVSTGAAYGFDPDRVVIDASLFGDHLASAHRLLTLGCPAESLVEAEAAIALWRGSPLDEIADSPEGEGRAASLQNQLLQALEVQVDSLFALDDYAKATVPLEVAVSEHPFHERLHYLRMLALYRSGRQTEALRAYEDARSVLVEAGLTPTSMLVELQGQILQQDPSLLFGAPKPAASGSGTSSNEIETLWSYGPAAHGDLRESLLGMSGNLVIAARGLTTVTRVFDYPFVGRSLDEAGRNGDISVRIIARSVEKDPSDTWKALHPFLRHVTTYSDGAEPTLPDWLELRTYEPGFEPRHFVVETDETIYFSPYLHRSNDSSSFLLKVRRTGLGLHELLKQELSCLVSCSAPISASETSRIVRSLSGN